MTSTMSTLSTTFSTFIKDHPKLFRFAVGTLAYLTVRKLISSLRRIVLANTVIELDLSDREVGEHPPPNDFFRSFNPKRLVFSELLASIYTIAEIEKVRAMVIKIDLQMAFGIAQLQELREAIKFLRSKGKLVIAVCDSFGEMQSGLAAYWLASACSHIFVSPNGYVTINKLLIASPFLKSALSKLEVDAEFEHRREYKNASNLFTEEKFTAEHKEATTSLIKDIEEVIMTDIANDRNLAKEEVNRIMKHGSLLAPEALKEKLVDGLYYREEVYDTQLVSLLGLKDKKQVRLYYLDTFIRDKLNNVVFPNGKHKVALIFAEGSIHQGKSQQSMAGPSSIGSESLVRSIDLATENKNIKAIVLRVNSGGGSAVASDVIMHALDRAKKQGKKVIVSFSSVAASGGYYISQHADKIVCSPTTITGSIGVVAGKFYIRKMLQNWGITYDFVAPDDGDLSSTSSSAMHKFSEPQKKRFNEVLDHVYELFKNGVASGRGLTAEEVEKVAQGRVWTGRQAKEKKLVDSLGGLWTAFDITKKELNLGEKDKLGICIYPPQKNFIQLVNKAKNSREETGADISFTSMFAIFETMSIFSAFVEQFGFRSSTMRRLQAQIPASAVAMQSFQSDDLI